MIAVSGEDRLVYITPVVTRGSTIACVEPATKTPDAYKDVLDVVTNESMAVESLPDQNAIRYGDFKRSIEVEGHTQFLHDRTIRIHNMRELLFELCQAYANNLINHENYIQLLFMVIEKTAALHAMEILVYQLDQHEYDDETRRSLIELAQNIIYTTNISDQPMDPERKSKTQSD